MSQTSVVGFGYRSVRLAGLDTDILNDVDEVQTNITKDDDGASSKRERESKKRDPWPSKQNVKVERPNVGTAFETKTPGRW